MLKWKIKNMEGMGEISRGGQTVKEEEGSGSQREGFLASASP